MTGSRDSSGWQDPSRGEDAHEPQIPARLGELLRHVSDIPGGLNAPAGFDEDILAMARARVRPRPVLRLLLRAGTGLAAAAALGLVVWIGWQANRPGRGGPALATLDPARQVDIVDAFALARRLRAGEAADASWDVTRDGAVDEQDVERLKAMAVRLDRATGGGA